MTATVIVWVTESTWPACIDAARAWTPAGAQVVLLHVADDEAAEVLHGAFLGLLGRGRSGPDDPEGRLEAVSAAVAPELLDAAAPPPRPPPPPAPRPRPPAPPGGPAGAAADPPLRAPPRQ